MLPAPGALYGRHVRDRARTDRRADPPRHRRGSAGLRGPGRPLPGAGLSPCGDAAGRPRRRRGCRPGGDLQDVAAPRPAAARDHDASLVPDGRRQPVPLPAPRPVVARAPWTGASGAGAPGGGRPRRLGPGAGAADARPARSGRPLPSLRGGPAPGRGGRGAGYFAVSRPLPGASRPAAAPAADGRRGGVGMNHEDRDRLRDAFNRAYGTGFTRPGLRERVLGETAARQARRPGRHPHWALTAVAVALALLVTATLVVGGRVVRLGGSVPAHRGGPAPTVSAAPSPTNPATPAPASPSPSPSATAC